MPERRTDSRRRFVRLAMASAFAAPLAGLMHAGAAEKPKLDPQSPRAQQLGYTHDAESTVDAARKEGAHCGNCTHFRGDADAQWAPCNIFPDHRVSIDGWCRSWFAKSG